MIIYEGKLQDFHADILSGTIADKIDGLFLERGLGHRSPSERRAWDNSLRQMSLVLSPASQIPQNLDVAIEYEIPLTSKRVDFLLAGRDSGDSPSAVIIELKQWEDASPAGDDKSDCVTTYLGGAERVVVHPSYQAYSYVEAIKHFNASVREGGISLHPCAYLHNFPRAKAPSLLSDRYAPALSLAPAFLREDAAKLQDFIKRFLRKPDRDGEVLYRIEHGEIKPSQALQDAVASLLAGNKDFVLIDEQKVAYETVLSLVRDSLGDGSKKHVAIVRGGPGTGKSVIAINLLSRLLNDGHNVQYVTKNAAPRHVFETKLIDGHFKKRYVENLFKGSGSYVGSAPDTFDCLLVDEAHRLNGKSGIYRNKGENQIKEIIAASRVSVFFLDEDQIVTSLDIGTAEEIRKWAKAAGAVIHEGKDLVLSSQFRCTGSDGYLAFLDDILGIRETANKSLLGLGYDFRVYDDPSKMREDLRGLNGDNKARLLAGYCHEWRSKKDPSAIDIRRSGIFKARPPGPSTPTPSTKSAAFTPPRAWNSSI